MLASEREQERHACLRNTGDDTEKQVYGWRERNLLQSQVHSVASGYSRIRAGDGARSSARGKVQGDGREMKVDPLGREHSGV